jgi:plasmid stabilization system protein ParE
LFHPLPYIAVYRVKEQDIEVLRIYHAAQDRP